MNYLKEDWKYLIILDALRADCFADVFEDYWLEFMAKRFDRGRVRPLKLGVTCTAHWYKKYWSEPNDVVLISANPQPFWEGSGYAAKNFKKAFQAWDGARVDPEVTLHYFKEKKDKGDRFLIHFVPPHLPFIGKRGKKLMKEMERDWHKPAIGREMYEMVQAYGRKDPDNWGILKNCYLEGVDIMVRFLVDNLDVFSDGKVVITSDHGELIGEGDMYDHPSKVKDRELEKILETVPYYEV